MTTVKIVRRPAEQRGFAVHPRRWVVEEPLAWLTAHRRLARDYERHPEVSEAFIRSTWRTGLVRYRPSKAVLPPSRSCHEAARTQA